MWCQSQSYDYEIVALASAILSCLKFFIFSNNRAGSFTNWAISRLIYLHIESIPGNSDSVCLGWSWKSCIYDKPQGHSEAEWALVSTIGERYVQPRLGYHDDLAQPQDLLCEMGPWYLLNQLHKIPTKGHTRNLRSCIPPFFSNISILWPLRSQAVYPWRHQYLFKDVSPQTEIVQTSEVSSTQRCK